MLSKCEGHGYYRGDFCPVCKKEGKFMMNDQELNSLSRIIAGALRHFPEKLGLMALVDQVLIGSVFII